MTEKVLHYIIDKAMKKFGLEFTEQQGRYYSDIVPQDFFIKSSEKLKKEKARLITATGFGNTGGDFFIYYHFEIGKKVFTFRTKLTDYQAESLAKLFPNISWIEREIAELYKIKFIGAKTKPLFSI